MSSDTEIRPFQVDMPEEAIADLRRRIDAMRWPGQELVADRSQGVQLATLQALARYWATDYDWRRCEKRLNALPQFTTEIDGTSIHFIHVTSRHENALPLIMTHGWPGSVVELLESVGPLTDPTAHGGRAEDAFDLVLPSLAGYGFSAAPTEVGWNPGRMAQAWAELMRRLGYTRYVAQGGDVGASVTDAMGRQAPEGLASIHMNLLVTTLGGAMPPVESEQERAAAAAIATFRASGFGTSWSRPRGRRRSATPCWIHPSPWRPGCSTTTPTPTTRSPAPSSTGSRPGASPGTTSSTTSPCTG
jgi:pimeloyl-ACP methyl ester carboxylesterase